MQIEEILIHYERRDTPLPEDKSLTLKVHIIIDGQKYGGLIPCEGEIKSSVQVQHMLAIAISSIVKNVAQCLGEPPVHLWIDKQGNITREKKT